MAVLCCKAWSVEQLLAQSQAQACAIFSFACRVYSSELHLGDEVQRVDLLYGPAAVSEQDRLYRNPPRLCPAQFKVSHVIIRL